MQHASQAAFGMAEPCALPPVDKWDILAALTKAAPGFGLSHRTLSVLKALMTFHPEHSIAANLGGAVVFPSNRKLSERLNGMPESTLRRHLAKLVEMGVVSRHDSPNRKRYARRIGADRAVAYGFDLSPLAVHAPQVQAAAAEADLRHQRVGVLRDRLASLRQQLLDSPLPEDPERDNVIELARLTLRRRASEEDLGSLVAQLQQIAAQIPPAPAVDSPLSSLAPAENLSGTDMQSERHIQESNRNESDSETRAYADRGHQPKATGKGKDTELQDVLAACKEYRHYCPAPMRSWEDLQNNALRLVPMMGIETPVFAEAQHSMGGRTAAMVILCMLERMSEIRSPGAYLRRLAQKAKAGQFSVAPLVNALRNRTGLSADNFAHWADSGNMERN
ncbi:plasmid replication protein RepC [Phaeobacter sp. CAU 1743]|uniref:plasmid replication protein RepC n=1 Tax=Phaeobacter sp. CAU 1743 TaxID=3140367 RepID=UPI00325BF24C